MTLLKILIMMAIALGVGLAGRTPALAHHAFAAEFDADQPVLLKGTISRMEWTNPHAWLYVDVKGPDGKVETWACELGGVNGLFKRGWTKYDLPVGAAVTVEGFRARNAAPKLSAGNITLADGKKLFGGATLGTAGGGGQPTPAPKPTP